MEAAGTAGRALEGHRLRVAVACGSALIRAQNTLKIMLEERGQTGPTEYRDPALNGRDCGDPAGLNGEEACRR
jgi:2,3-bisphosphoglycerate-dependent phosphoglycerate mutase